MEIKQSYYAKKIQSKSLSLDIFNSQKIHILQISPKNNNTVHSLPIAEIVSGEINNK